MVTLSEKLTGELSFFEIIIGIVLALILVALWQRATENFVFGYIGLDPNSAYQTFVVAVTFTIIFFVILNIVDDLTRNLILGVSENTTSVVQTSNATQETEITLCKTGCGKKCKKNIST